MISVITTVRNGEKYLLETLDSLRKQVFKDFEHIVVDDGSSDNTVKILNKFNSTYPDYKLKIVLSKAIGRGKALNLGIQHAEYDYIAILDADDIWHPQKLKFQNHFLRSNHNIGVLATQNELFTSSVNEFSMLDIEDIKIIDVKLKAILYKNLISHSSVVMKKDLAYYNESLKSQFDYELWLRILQEHQSVIKIVDAKLNYHRIHENQSFESKGGNAYKIRAYKLNAKFCLKHAYFMPLIYNTLRLCVNILLPRKIKFFKLR